MVSLHIPLNYSVNVVAGFFNLTHVRNSGVAFGIFSEQNSELKPYLLIFVSIIAIIAILVMFPMYEYAFSYSVFRSRHLLLVESIHY